MLRNSTVDLWRAPVGLSAEKSIVVPLRRSPLNSCRRANSSIVFQSDEITHSGVRILAPRNLNVFSLKERVRLLIYTSTLAILSFVTLALILTNGLNLGRGQ